MTQPTTCTRCGDEGATLTILVVQAGSHSLPILAPPPPRRVCGNCITDDELERELGPVAAFVLGVHIERTLREPGSPQRDNWLRTLEMARTPFIVVNNDPDDTNRGDALRAVGLVGKRS